MSTVIFNADDYGAHPEIDDGVISAIQNKRLNSVAMFANGPDIALSASKIKGLQNMADVGLHFTITSGKPMSAEMKDSQNERRGDHYFVKKNGEFRNFLRMKRAGTLSHSVRMSQKRLVKAELIAQLNALRANGIMVKHISSHHNTLFFFPEYLEALFEVIAEDKDPVPLKIRSVFLQPNFNRNAYPKLIGFASLFTGGMDVADSVKISRFNRVILKWVETYRKRGNPVPEMPFSADSAHYGPPPVLPKGKSTRRRIAKRKADKFLESVLTYLNRGQDVEFLFHLIDPEVFRNIDKLNNAEKNRYKHNYVGVTPQYFDRRAIEYDALEIFMNAGHQISRKEFELKENPWNQIK